MTPTDRTVSRHVKLSSRLSIDITFGVAGMVCEWDPCPMRLTKREERAYYAARNACASELARLIGASVLVADLSGRGLSGMLCFTPDGGVEQQ